MRRLSHADLSGTRASERRVIARTLPYLWPPGLGWVKRRVVGSLLLLVLAKPELGEVPLPDWLLEPRGGQLPFDVPRR